VPEWPHPPIADELVSLREEFSSFRIWREAHGERARYVAQRLHPGLHPHTVVTADPEELRAVLHQAE
jgi:cytosine/adenosine deaminase-related metal-dependent hydrolase